MNFYLNAKKNIHEQKKEGLYTHGVLDKCPECHGRRYYNGFSCKRCNGEGYIYASGYSTCNNN